MSSSSRLPEPPDESDYEYGSGTEHDADPSSGRGGDEGGQTLDSPPMVADSVRYAAPEIALGHDMGQAVAYGSPKARRKAKIVAWVLIASFVIPTLIGLFSFFT